MARRSPQTRTAPARHRHVHTSIRHEALSELVLRLYSEEVALFEETVSLLYVLENFDEIINLCSNILMDHHQI